VLVVGSVLWNGATDSIRRGRALSRFETLRVSQVMEPAVFLEPQTPVQLALDHPAVVVTTDARGIPCLLLAAPGGVAPAGLDPAAPLSSAVVRIPDDSVLEVSPDANALAVVEVIQGTGFPDVVLTWHGQVYGIAHARLVNEATARN